jgi:hypothetical protein
LAGDRVVGLRFAGARFAGGRFVGTGRRFSERRARFGRAIADRTYQTRVCIPVHWGDAVVAVALQFLQVTSGE